MGADTATTHRAAAVPLARLARLLLPLLLASPLAAVLGELAQPARRTPARPKAASAAGVRKEFMMT